MRFSRILNLIANLIEITVDVYHHFFVKLTFLLFGALVGPSMEPGAGIKSVTIDVLCRNCAIKFPILFRSRSNVL